MEEIGVFTPEQARLLWQEYLSRKQLQPQQQANYAERKPIDEVSPHRVFVKNTASEVIPAYACLRTIGTEVIGGRTAIKVEKPTSVEGEFLFNSPYEIAIGGTGWAYRFDVIVMRGTSVAPTAPNVLYSPVVASWSIIEAAGPFMVFGTHNAGTNSLIGRFEGGGSVVTNVRFKIVSSDPLTFKGLAEVLAWDYGFILSQVPALIIGSVIEICDPRGCFLNEPNVELTGRQGTAVYRQGVAEDICRVGYAPFPGVWEVDGLCCKLISCDVVI